MTPRDEQPVGPQTDWVPGARLGPVALAGRWCRLEPLGERHLPALHAELCGPGTDPLWTYLRAGPFPDSTGSSADPAGFTAYAASLVDDPGTVPLAVLVDDEPLGIATWLRVDHANGTAEVGNISLGPRLQRTTAATEAMHLMARHFFEAVGGRRYEWKCDSLNAASRRAAERLGFRPEGVFRKAVVYKGRSRDTAWYAMTDDDWPRVRAAHERWLDPAGFDDEGRQRAPLRVPPPSTDPAPPTAGEDSP